MYWRDCGVALPSPQTGTRTRCYSAEEKQIDIFETISKQSRYQLETVINILAKFI